VRYAAVILTVLVLFGVAAGAHAQIAPAGMLTEPFVETDSIERTFFGDDEDVALLAGLLDDPGPSVRERVVRDLGQTSNEAAIGHVRKALNDASEHVRSAAVKAAVELSPIFAREAVEAGLADAHKEVVLTSLRLVRQGRMSWAAARAREALARKEPVVQAAALETLWALESPVPAATLEPLLESESATVRLWAARSVALLRAPSTMLEGELLRMAETGPPAIRAEAMGAVARNSFGKVASLAGRCASDSGPFLRRGAVLAYAAAGRGNRIRPFLDDSSPLVRLAAIRAAGALRQADCVERLVELMETAPAEQSHAATRESLVHIAGDKVASAVAAALRRAGSALGDSDKRKAETAVRNLRSCCIILGELKSNVALDDQLSLLEQLNVESDSVADIASSLGMIGDKRAAGPLEQKLRAGRQRALSGLRTLGGMRPNPMYEKPSAEIVEALGRLGATESADTILMMTNLEAGGFRLGLINAYAARWLPKLLTDDNRGGIADSVVANLRHRSYAGSAEVVRFEACKAAAVLGLKDALDDLSKTLADNRQQPRVMQAAAWAIQELTGEAPEIPAPLPYRGPRWIVRKQ